MKKYKYWGFGLNIISEIEFPELLAHEFDAPHDLQIQLGTVPQNILDEKVVNKAGVSTSPTKYLLNIEGVASYYVSNGNSIMVEPADTDEKSVRLFLLSNCMAAVLHQQNKISMHASAIEHNGGLILFCGRSGAGKSTTVGMLKQKGYTLFSDDVCVLNSSGMGKAIEAYSSYPMMKLWEDSFEKVGIEMATEVDKIRPQLPKYAHFYHNDFNIKPKPIKLVFILSIDNQTETAKIERLQSLKAFAALQQNTYRYGQMIDMRKRDVHFATISALAKTTPVYKISRPPISHTLSEVFDLITATIYQNERPAITD